MNRYHQAPEGKDPQLWEQAQRRVSFKYHLGTYVIINGFLWILWYLTGEHRGESGWPWPLWPTLGWGIGLAFHFVGAYVFPRSNSVDREYDKLKKKK